MRSEAACDVHYLAATVLTDSIFLFTYWFVTSADKEWGSWPHQRFSCRHLRGSRGSSLNFRSLFRMRELFKNPNAWFAPAGVSSLCQTCNNRDKLL